MNQAKRSPAAATDRAANLSTNQHVNHTESPITKLLGRLDKVKETGRGQYLACCPAHDDGSPSLSVREADDGKVLLHCFAQCPPADVLAAVGMELRDLFAQSYESRPKSRYERRIGPKDAIAALAYEATIITIIASDIKERQACDKETFERLALAASRIGAARAMYR